MCRVMSVKKTRMSGLEVPIGILDLVFGISISRISDHVFLLSLTFRISSFEFQIFA